MNEIPENAILLIGGQHGVNIPKLFVNMFPEHMFFEEGEILRGGPDGEVYWQIWEDALSREFIHPILGEGYLYQDGDLWFIPHENI